MSLHFAETFRTGGDAGCGPTRRSARLCTSKLWPFAPDASMASTAYRLPGGQGMVKFVARRSWSLTLLALVMVLAGCKSGSGGGGY
jgi:hypothetical protein